MSNHNLEEIRLKGYVISSGIAIGKPFFLKTLQKNFHDENVPIHRIDVEIKRFNYAVSLVVQDLQLIKKQLELEKVDDGVAILETQLHLLSDPLIIEEVEKQIKLKRKIPEYILQELIQVYQKKFDAFKDAFFRERFRDVQDLSKRILNYLLEESKSSLSDLCSESILFAKDLSPLETAEASQKQVRAIVSERGSATAHASILARAKEIPFMTNISLSEVSHHADSIVIVDGKGGQLIINPTQKTLELYEKLREELIINRQNSVRSSSQDIRTYDGYKMTLLANIETKDEISKIHEFGGEGVGLYRSENILVGRENIPSEDEQFEIYRELVTSMNALPITIRIFDVGRDKVGMDLRHKGNDTPFLGFRAIGNKEAEKEIFMAQLRAILRASKLGNVNILIPMVSSLAELTLAKQMIQKAAEQLNMVPRVGLGCMIEIPSAALIVDFLAQECDFLSIGTNDLIQYTLAVDRCDHHFNHLYQPMHPCILRLIRHVVVEANRFGIPVSICGEMAANPKFTSLLLGLGIHEISVAARYIPLIKQSIRFSNIISSCQLAEHALALTNALEIQNLIDETFERNFARSYFESLI